MIWLLITGLVLVEKKQPFLQLTSCYQCSKYTTFTPDHAIPLAIGLLKGISGVLSHYNTGLLLFNRMSSNYWAVITGEKI
jgi:hypothetical protein